MPPLIIFIKKLRNFEDAVQIACAISQSLDAIMTCDTQGFLSSTVPVLSIHELLQQLGAQDSE